MPALPIGRDVAALIFVFLLVALVTLAGNGCAPGSVPDASAAEAMPGDLLSSDLTSRDPTARALDASVVLVGAKPYCGGVAVARHAILTAAHCVGGDRAMLGSPIAFVPREAWFQTARASEPAYVYGVDVFQDRALLETAFEFPTFVERRRMRWPEAAYLIRRFDVTRANAEWEGLRANGGGRLRWTGIRPGDSGSGIFGLDGALIGIVTMCESTPAGECLPKGAFFTGVAP